MRGIVGKVLRGLGAALFGGLLASASTAQPQQVSVSFPLGGYIGTVGNNTGQADYVVDIANLGFTSARFSQNSTTGLFGDPVGTQGNDYCGTLTLTYQGQIDFNWAVCVNWRITTQGDLDYIGFIPDPNANTPTTTWAYSGTYAQPNGGYVEVVPGFWRYFIDSTSNFAFRTSQTASTYPDGTNISGNAAAAQALAALNTWAFPAGYTAPASATINGQTVNADATAAEDGSDDATILFALTSAPTADVTVTFADSQGAECSYSPNPITFTSSNWADAQAITVTAVDDTLNEGPHSCTPVASFQSSDSNYNNLSPATLSAITITDNDAPGYSELPSATVNGQQLAADTSVAEDGSDTGLILFVLDAAPTQDVTVSFAESFGECQYSPSSITYTAQNWADAQAITVTATDDGDIEGNHTCSTVAMFSSTDQGYNQLGNVGLTQISVTDNDVAGFNELSTAIVGGATVSADSEASEDGDTATILINLKAAPTQDVTVGFLSTPGQQCSFSPAPLTFTANNWAFAQQVTVTAIDDTVNEGPHSCTPTVVMTSSDFNFNQLTGTLTTITIADNDTPGYATPSTGTVNGQPVAADTTAAEDGSEIGTILMNLTAAPTADVTVTFADANGASECTYLPTSITFDTFHWADVQAVTVVAVDDGRVEGPHSCTPVATFSSSDPGYNQLSPATLTAVSIADNDSVGFQTPSSDLVNGVPVTADLNLSENGDTGIFLFRLTSEPVNPVSVQFSNATGIQCGFQANPIVFTSADWNQTQAVTVTAVDDAVVEGDHLCSPVATFVSFDADYGNMAQQYLSTLTISDNDWAAYTSPLQGSVNEEIVDANDTASEDGDTGLFLFGLTSEPVSDVTVTFSSLTGEDCAFAPGSITITAADWQELRTVTVEAIDDALVEGNELCTPVASFFTVDPNYQLADAQLNSILITDNDEAGATLPDEAVIDGVEVSADAEASEDGDPARILMRLDSEPSGPVNVSFVDPTGQCDYTPNPLSFDPADWDTVKAVIVTAVDDGDTETDQTCQPIGVMSSNDTEYDGRQVVMPMIAVIDNDDAGIDVAQNATSATEGGDDGMLSFALTALPQADVTLSFAGDGQCSVSPESITFGPGDFDAWQAIAIIATDDDETEGVHACQPTVTVTSADARYDGMVLALPAIAIHDDRVDQVREPLTTILQDDLEQTMARQSANFAGISRGALNRLQDGAEDEGCGTVTAPDVDGTAEAEAGTVEVAGTFGSETYDCVRGERELVWGEFAMTRSEDIGTQGMLTFGVARERETEAEIRGWFWGGYGSRYSVDGQGATGDISGFGLNGGLYGARELEDGVWADYYAALAGGLHSFDLDFDGLVATGDYRWIGAFAGVAVSGEMVFPTYVLRPRVGLDAGYAVADDPEVEVTDLDITETGIITLDPAIGLRLFAEAGFVIDATPDETGGLIDEVFEITPRLFCERGFGTEDDTCGWGLALDYARSDFGTGVDWTVGLSHERTEVTERTSLRLGRERTILNGAGTVTSGVSLSPDAAPVVSHGIEILW